MMIIANNIALLIKYLSREGSQEGDVIKREVLRGGAKLSALPTHRHTHSRKLLEGMNEDQSC